MYERENSIGYLINQAARLTHKTMRLQLGPESPHPAYLPVLLWLREKNGQSQADLCGRAGIEQPSMAELLKRMQKDGLLTRKPDPTDSRRKQLFLTSKAKRYSSQLLAWLDAHNAAIAKEVTPADRAKFMYVLRQMISNMEGAIEAAEYKKDI